VLRSLRTLPQSRSSQMRLSLSSTSRCRLPHDTASTLHGRGIRVGSGTWQHLSSHEFERKAIIDPSS
jgi:hypothetical protein